MRAYVSFYDDRVYDPAPQPTPTLSLYGECVQSIANEACSHIAATEWLDPRHPPPQSYEWWLDRWCNPEHGERFA